MKYQNLSSKTCRTTLQHLFYENDENRKRMNSYWNTQKTSTKYEHIYTEILKKYENIWYENPSLQALKNITVITCKNTKNNLWHADNDEKFECELLKLNHELEKDFSPQIIKHRQIR